MSEIVDKILREFRFREAKGLEKYKTTMDRTDLSLIQWLEHLKEELMDATLYIQKAIDTLKKVEK
jgi:hypothetical protein